MHHTCTHERTTLQPHVGVLVQYKRVSQSLGHPYTQKNATCIAWLEGVISRLDRRLTYGVRVVRTLTSLYCPFFVDC